MQSQIFKYRMIQVDFRGLFLLNLFFNYVMSMILKNFSYELCSNPIQPKSCVFPQTKGRRFNPDWYLKYSWLEYSVLIDRAFCFPCRLFGGNNSDYLKKNGWKSWKDGYRNLADHENSASNHNSHNSLSRRKLLSVPIHRQVNSQFEATVMRNRSNVKTIFQVIIFLAKQGLAFIGHFEHSESKNKV